LLADENTANALTTASAYRPITLLLLLLLLAVVAFKSKIRFAPRDEREIRFNPLDSGLMGAFSGSDDGLSCEREAQLSQRDRATLCVSRVLSSAAQLYEKSLL